MLRIIFFFTKLLFIFFIFLGNWYALELSIIPIKKPILDKKIENQNLSQEILKPKPKPKIKIEKEKIKITKKKIKKLIF